VDIGQIGESTDIKQYKPWFHEECPLC